MKRMLMAGLLFGACKTETATFLEVALVASPSNACAFEVPPESFESEGFFDPAADGDRAYTLPLVLINHAAFTEDDVAVTTGGRPFKSALNNVMVSGFNVCWYRGDEARASEYGAFDDGEIAHCDDLPEAQRTFVLSSGEVFEGGGAAVISPSVLSEAAFQAPAIYGEDFDIDDIPFSEFGGEETRTGGVDGAAPWGNYPTQATSRLVVQVQAVGRTTGGRNVSSNWFLFPIDICINCVINACGPLTDVTCTDGSAGLSGQIIDAESSCFPAQNFILECEDFTSCDA